MSGKPRYLSITIVASLAGLLFGFDTAVISGVTQSLREVFHLSPATLGTAVSSALWGTLCGALFMGKLGDRFGTRDMLKLVGVFYLVSAVGCSLAWNLESFIAFRFIGGIAIGGSSVLACRTCGVTVTLSCPLPVAGCSCVAPTAPGKRQHSKRCGRTCST